MATRPPADFRQREERTASPPGAHPTLQQLAQEARGCRACPLWNSATQTVFGAGPQDAPIMLVGEQPGDQEDLAGEPFMGPAGKILDRALADAGIDRSRVYVTNAVKHFKFEPRGKRRIHKKPSEMEIDACHQWLDRELEAVAPRLVIALGATAVRALLGRATPIQANRGRLTSLTPQCKLLISVHPSFLLRVPPEFRDEEYQRFVADLCLAAPFQDR
jgi:uracil-DNA glycosylase